MSEQSQALQRTDVAPAASTKSASVASSQNGFTLGKTYSVDDAGVIESASGTKLSLPPTSYYGTDAVSAAQIGIGGTGLGGGGLNAWGCWTGSCCVAGHYEAGPVGWVWVCDAYRDCRKCLIGD